MTLMSFGLTHRYVDRNPWAFVGTAFGVAFLLGLMIPRR